jgi:hypothetical protein
MRSKFDAPTILAPDAAAPWSSTKLSGRNKHPQINGNPLLDEAAEECAQ